MGESGSAGCYSDIADGGAGTAAAGAGGYLSLIAQGKSYSCCCCDYCCGCCGSYCCYCGCGCCCCHCGRLAGVAIESSICRSGDSHAREWR